MPSKGESGLLPPPKEIIEGPLFAERMRSANNERPIVSIGHTMKSTEILDEVRLTNVGELLIMFLCLGHKYIKLFLNTQMHFSLL